MPAMHSPDLPGPLLRRLREILGEDALLTAAGERVAYGFDNSRRQGMPGAVALPTARDQVQAIVAACHAHRHPLVGRGRGTNTTGASVPVEGALVVAFERMDRIVSIAPADRLAVVEPGVLNGRLQDALAGHGFFWPPDPTSAPYCTVAGNIATNAGGPRAVKYGATRDSVLGLQLVTGTGELVRCGGPTTKSSTGYDFTRFVIGSEGTLGLVVEATLKLSPRPAARRALRLLYADVPSAAAAVSRLMAQPVVPSMLEFMDGDCVRLAREVGGADLPAAGALLMVEADGESDTLDGQVQALLRAATGPGLVAAEAAPDEAARERLWAARKALSPALRTIAPGKINEDVVVPVSRIPDLVAAVRALANRHRLTIVCFGHAGNGNLHTNILYDSADAAESERANAAMHGIFDAVLSMDGTLSGEHGIGLAKRDFMARAFDPPTLALMRAVKDRFDPAGILNPGKLLPGEAGTG